MIPGMNSRQAKQMMRKMGIQQVEVDALQVVITTKDKELVFDKPDVSKVNMMGQDTYQVVGTPRVRDRFSISEDDIRTVADQAGVDEEKAKEALDKSSGDIAEAIMSLQE